LRCADPPYTCTEPRPLGLSRLIKENGVNKAFWTMRALLNAIFSDDEQEIEEFWTTSTCHTPVRPKVVAGTVLSTSRKLVGSFRNGLSRGHPTHDAFHDLSGWLSRPFDPETCAPSARPPGVVEIEMGGRAVVRVTKDGESLPEPLVSLTPGCPSIRLISPPPGAVIEPRL